MSSRTIIVTGGAGFVGSHLCDAILERGDRVLCVDNLVGSGGVTRNIDHMLGHERFEFINEDLVAWAADADLTGVDTIFHEAASKNTVCMTNPELDLEVNALGTLRLLRAAQRDGVRKFVHGSTGSVFGELVARQDENHPKNPRSFYGVSKLAGESYCKAFGELFDMDFTVLRYYHVIGPRQDDSDVGGVVPIFIRNCENGEDLTIYGTGEQVRSFTSVFDVVKANLMVADAPQARQQVFNCASSIQVSIQQLADFVIEEMGTETAIRYDDWRPGDIMNFDIHNEKILELGMEFQRDWREVVRGVIRSRTDQSSVAS